ncbi:MAG: hypothetical protein IKU24_02920 [Clostridia bacterium]|nr:hypothetical protein [Clostridia bacterium]
MNRKKVKFGFSILDGILIVLAVFCILSTVFQTQIRTFFSNDKREEVEYTFLIENASYKGRNYPMEGEEIFLSEDLSSLGRLKNIGEIEKVYQSETDSEDKIKVISLTCQGRVFAEKTEMGYLVGEKKLKPGAMFSVQTESASFTMVITMVKAIDE